MVTKPESSKPEPSVPEFSRSSSLGLLVTSTDVRVHFIQMTFIQVGGEEGAFSSVGEDRLKKRVTEREKKFYESLLDKNAVLKDYVPHFYGVESHGDEHYVIMENLLADYAKPCVLDIKMGTTSVPEDATPTEKVIMDREDQNSTTSSMGIQLIGMQYFDQNEETVRRERPWGKELKEGQMAGALRQFFGPKETRVRVLPVVLHNLCQIRSVIESQQHGVRLYSSSILIAYDGDMGGMSKTPRVRMIDFAHVFPIEEGGGIDEAYLVGIRNLIRILQEELPEDPHGGDN